MQDNQLRILFSEDELKKRIEILGKEISGTYKGISQKLLVICILKGAVIFFSDLVRHIDIPLDFDFMRIKSYGYKQESSRDVTCCMRNEFEVHGRDVLIIEDIVDSGHSMKFLIDHFQLQEPKSLRIAALLSKTSRREINIEIDFVGFTVDSGFLVGYGLDFDEKHRGLPSIYELEH